MNTLPQLFFENSLIYQDKPLFNFKKGFLIIILLIKVIIFYCIKYKLKLYLKNKIILIY